MLTFNTIVKELKNVPVNRIEELYAIMHSLRVNTKKTAEKNKEILSFAGAFADMDENDYNDFLQQTKDTRSKLFERSSNL